MRREKAPPMMAKKTEMRMGMETASADEREIQVHLEMNEICILEYSKPEQKQHKEKIK
jgi:hypothetical protein